MSDYKRFVSYIYNYEKKEKKNNVGYARIENRGTKCKITIHVQIRSISVGTIKAYGFVRKGRDLQGILLGDISLRNGSGDCQITTQVDKVGDTNYQFSDLGGIILYISDSKFFGSQWDDIPIEYETFEEEIKIEAQGKETILKTAELKEEEVKEKAMQAESIEKAAEEVSAVEEVEELSEESKETKETEEELEKLDLTTTPNFETFTLKEIYNRFGYHVTNDFMLHGYRRFGHLGVMDQNERKVIGVPGVFCRREQEVAKNYGFENFLPRVPKKLQYGDFGYWYANIENLK